MMGLMCLDDDCFCETGPPPECETTYTQTVRGCNSALQTGVTVLLKVAGSTVDTQVTDGSGVAVLTYAGPFPASATVEIPAQGGYQAYSVPVTLNCVPLSGSATLSVASTHVCCPTCNVPIPKTLYLTCAKGSATLTWVSAYLWEGTLSFTDKVPKTGLPFPNTFPCACGPPTGTINVEKFETETGTVSYLIQFQCNAFLRIGDGTINFTWWRGQTDCTSSDWCYLGTATPSGSPKNSGASTAFADITYGCASPGSFTASGTIADPAAELVVMTNCAGTFVLGPNTEAPINPVGPWTLSA